MTDNNIDSEPKISVRPPKWIIFVSVIVIIGLASTFYIFLLPQLNNSDKPNSPLIEPNVVNTTDPNSPDPTQAVYLLPEFNDQSGAIVLSMRDGNFIHLFLYNPANLPLVRITDNPWDDISPAISPDGTKIAYSSRQNGYWDLYLLDLQTNKVARLTDTPQYDGSPSWSPDGQYLAFETYNQDNLDIFILNTSDLSEPPIQLTDNKAGDFSPVWAPGGREIAFVSTRNGQQDIWLARLDNSEDRFINISKSSEILDDHPTWSPDGKHLAWGANDSGAFSVMIWDAQSPDQKPLEGGTGYLPVWAPDGNSLIVFDKTSNQPSLLFYHPFSGTSWEPGQKLPGEIYGADWKTGTPIELLSKTIDLSRPAIIPTLWYPVLTVTPPPNGRKGIVAINDVNVPYAFLQDEVDESYYGLRQQISLECGWDYLDTLENAYLPLTEPPQPGLAENWLFTGRAILTNSMPIQADWMRITRENIGGEIFWRIFLKARYQDGSQGMPMKTNPWDLDSRYKGDPEAYEGGGKYGPIPAGYWVDFTEIASRFGWLRLSALPNWKTYYAGTRYNLYIHPDLVDWNRAMQELYPPEALWTFTPVPTRTPTFTPTPQGTRTIIPTATITLTMIPTNTPTNRPTWTPVQATATP